MQILLTLQQWTNSTLTADCTQQSILEIDSSRWMLIEDYMNREGVFDDDLLAEILDCFLSAKCNAHCQDIERSGS